MKYGEKLIAAVQVRPFLYEPKRETHYADFCAIKIRGWQEVARIVYGKDDRVTVSKVKMKWKSLRDAFVKHQRRRQNATTKIRPYVYEEEMQFLLPHILVKEKDDDEGGNMLAHSEIKKEKDRIEGDIIEDPRFVDREELARNEPVDAFFHGIAQTVKQLSPATIARIKKAVANLVMDAEIEEIERDV